MAVEARRGCGYRMAGALYLCGPQPSFACGRLPLPTDQPLFRNLKQLNIKDVLEPSQDKPCQREQMGQSICNARCWARWPPDDPEATIGMLWVGETDYTPQTFTAEAVEMGLSKRIPGIPKWLELGKTQIFLAHISAYRYNRCLRCGLEIPLLTPKGKAIMDAFELVGCPKNPPDGKHDPMGPGLFMGFIPQAVECLVEKSKLDEEWVIKLLQRGVTVIEIPDGDPDHTDRVKGVLEAQGRASRAFGAQRAKEEPFDPDNRPQRRSGHGGAGRGLQG